MRVCNHRGADWLKLSRVSHGLKQNKSCLKADNRHTFSSFVTTIGSMSEREKAENFKLQDTLNAYKFAYQEGRLNEIQVILFNSTDFVIHNLSI